MEEMLKTNKKPETAFGDYTVYCMFLPQSGWFGNLTKAYSKLAGFQDTLFTHCLFYTPHNETLFELIASGYCSQNLSFEDYIQFSVDRQERGAAEFTFELKDRLDFEQFMSFIDSECVGKISIAENLLYLQAVKNAWANYTAQDIFSLDIVLNLGMKPGTLWYNKRKRTIYHNPPITCTRPFLYLFKDYPVARDLLYNIPDSCFMTCKEIFLGYSND